MIKLCSMSMTIVLCVALRAKKASCSLSHGFKSFRKDHVVCLNFARKIH